MGKSYLTTRSIVAVVDGMLVFHGSLQQYCPVPLAFYAQALSPPQRPLLFFRKVWEMGERLKVTARSLERWANGSARGHWEGRKREERPLLCNVRFSGPSIFHFSCFFVFPPPPPPPSPLKVPLRRKEARVRKGTERLQPQRSLACVADGTKPRCSLGLSSVATQTTVA